MPSLGTKQFWIPSAGASATQRDNQILKNAGYINIQLFCVNYMATGNFFQHIFGGSDKVVLATNLKFESGVSSIEASSVQDMRKVRVHDDASHSLGLQRNIAVKIPSSANAIAMDVKLTAVKDDQLEAKFDMLNKPEYQAALQLAPMIVGQVLTITSLVKKLFTDTDPQLQLQASFAGIISSQAEDNPVKNGKLTTGKLVMISTDEGESFDDVDERKFELRGDSLFFNNHRVENTYAVFNIGFEPLKGEDQNSNWFEKYNQAVNNLDKILVSGEEEFSKIFNDSKTMWIEGNALLQADQTYINSEKTKIKATAFKTINDRFRELTQTTPQQLNIPNIIQGLTGGVTLDVVRDALPQTGKFLSQNLDESRESNLGGIVNLPNLANSSMLAQLISDDANSYLKELQAHNKNFKLGRDVVA